MSIVKVKNAFEKLLSTIISKVHLQGLSYADIVASMENAIDEIASKNGSGKEWRVYIPDSNGEPPDD